MKWLTFLYIPFYEVYFIIKRPLFMLLFPIAWFFRHEVRGEKAGEYKGGLIGWFLWIMLNDECYYDIGNGTQDTENHTGTKSFWADYYFSALRNNAVNLSIYVVNWGKPIKSDIVGNSSNFVRFSKYAKFPYLLPYLQFFFYKTDIRFKIGWQSNGRFEQSIRKKERIIG